MDPNPDETQNADLRLCIICQQISGEILVENPSCHEKTLQAIEEWATYGEARYVRNWEQLRRYSLDKLKEAKASWHRTCYKNVVHSGKLKRAKARYESQLEGPSAAKRKSDVTIEEAPQLTRSKTTPFNKDVCFFCDGFAGYRQSLHNVSTTSAGESLRYAIQTSSNAKLQVKLNSAINPSDAHAIDIKYHKNCWNKNVTNVLRKSQSTTSGTTSSSHSATKAAAQIEFISLTLSMLKSGKIVTMSNLQNLYEAILDANNSENPTITRKTLKGLLQHEIPDIEFHKPKRINESERVTVKSTRDFAVQQSEDYEESEESEDDCEEEMKVLFDAATLLRKAINKSKAWHFTGSFNDIGIEHIPQELSSFCRWLINGSIVNKEGVQKSDEMKKRALSLSQTIIHMCLTERQRRNTKSQVLKSGREMPQQLAVGLAVRQSIRSKEIINMLHGFGMSVEYNK